MSEENKAVDERDDEQCSLKVDASTSGGLQDTDKDKEVKEDTPASPTIQQCPTEDSHLDEELEDAVSEMTYGRRIARWLSKYRWYNPHVDDAYENALQAAGQVQVLQVTPPSLDSAWAYFEHYSLPRHKLKETAAPPTQSTIEKIQVHRWISSSSKDVLIRAKYGERDEPTRLYNVFTTPEAELGDFGVGVGIYFWTLRALAIIMLLAGFINLPNMIYFSSTDYSALGQGDVSSFGVAGSAVCTDQVWKACPTCSREDWSDFPSDYQRYASTGSLSFILRNECEIRLREGIVAFISLVFVCISMYVMGRISQRREVRFDESQQTTPDYSLEVENPPLDAIDPNDWRDFFENMFDGDDDSHVTVCTVVLDNEDLIRALVQRRKLLAQMEYLLQPGVPFDTENLDEMIKYCFPVPCWQKWLLLAPDAPTLLKQIRKVEQHIETLAKKEKNVSNVFITFETEQAQRRALKALSVPRLDVWRKKAWKYDDKFLFRGQHVLAVKEPPEPTSVRWQDLDEKPMKKIVQVCVSTTVSLAAVAAGAVLIALARRRSAVASAITISILNQVTPQVCRFINDHTESHSSDGSRQASLYIKMTFFRWVNTVIVPTILLAFTESITDGKDFLINSVYAIFFSELLITPANQLSDLWGNFQRHYLAPRSADQRRMNLKFRGGYFQLAERFTGMTKIIFLTVFYAALYPGGFFFAAVTLIVVYWTDKFSLFRIWGPSPSLGTKIAEFSRSYFFSLALAAYALMVSYNYAGWPFDNACESTTPVSDDYVGTYTAVDGNGNIVSVTIEDGDNEFFFCLQDMFRFKNPVAFPALPRFQREGEEWMTSDQEKVAAMLGWTSIVVLFLVAVIFINRILIRFLRNLFTNTYKPVGEATDIGFSQVKERCGYSVSGYVPQIAFPGFEYPLLACDVTEIDPELIGWEDAYHGFDSHNLIYDMKGLADSEKPLFSIVKNWKPGEVQEESYDA